MDKKRSVGLRILGITLMIIAIFPVIKQIIILATILSEQNLLSLKNIVIQTRLSFYAQMVLSYTGIDAVFSKILNLLSLYQTKTIACIITAIKYLAILCNITLFIAGVGLFFRKKIFYISAILALAIMLILGVVHIAGMFLEIQKVYIDNILSLILFGILIYCFTRPKVKEQFK